MDTLSLEKKARRWDRWTTILIVALLFLPFPFARFETVPDGGLVTEHLIVPWSKFRICYTDFLTGECVEDVYSFNWKGELLPYHTTSFDFPEMVSSTPPLLKWQELPELVLRECYDQGEMLRVETSWHSLLMAYLSRVWRVSMHPSGEAAARPAPNRS